MTHLLTGEGLASIATLTFLEIVLSVDNLVFLAVAIERLAPAQRRLGRQVGLTLAMFLRIAMLMSLVWISRLDVSLFWVAGRAFTIKDVVLICGGLFLLAKGTTEIHDTIEVDPDDLAESGPAAGFLAVMAQLTLINIIFSLDSVITAVGMTNDLVVMIAAVIASTLVMLFAARPVGEFIHERPTTKMLALAFILLIGIALVADGLGVHVPRTYIYFAIAFSLFVEFLNVAYRRARRRRGHRDGLSQPGDFPGGRRGAPPVDADFP